VENEFSFTSSDDVGVLSHINVYLFHCSDDDERWVVNMFSKGRQAVQDIQTSLIGS
jgi:hypothetical protein